MSDNTKQTVYNPRTAEKRIKDLEAKVRSQGKRVIDLLKENTELKIKIDEIEQLRQIIDTQQQTINTYGKIFMIQDAELKKLREGKHNETN